MRARRLLWLVIGLLPFAMFAPLSHRLGAVDTLSEQAVALRRDEVEAAELWAAGALAVRQEQIDQAAPQPSACWYEGAVSFSGRPSAGAVVVVAETGFSIRTDTNGAYRIPIPGPGVWNVRIAADGFAPLTVTLVYGDGCMLLDRMSGGGGMRATPTPTATRSATPAASSTPAAPSKAEQVSGAVLVEGRPAPIGVMVRATINNRICGTARTDADGRFRLEVAHDETLRGCGAPGIAVQMTLTPGFGSSWAVGEPFGFTPGANSAVDLMVDLRLLAANPDNVPWNGAYWGTVSEVPYGICGNLSDEVLGAVEGGFRQWQEATDGLGLIVRLVRDDAAVCPENARGIAVVEGRIPVAGALAAALTYDDGGTLCTEEAPCYAHRSFIVVNTREFLRASALDQPNVIAHEAGHALGLAHSRRCTGGTIMWADTRCRYPLTHIGVDDIASLNQKFAAVN